MCYFTNFQPRSYGTKFIESLGRLTTVIIKRSINDDFTRIPCNIRYFNQNNILLPLAEKSLRFETARYCKEISVDVKKLESRREFYKQLISRRKRMLESLESMNNYKLAEDYFKSKYGISILERVRENSHKDLVKELLHDKITEEKERRKKVRMEAQTVYKLCNDILTIYKARMDPNVLSLPQPVDTNEKDNSKEHIVFQLLDGFINKAGDKKVLLKLFNGSYRTQKEQVVHISALRNHVEQVKKHLETFQSLHLQINQQVQQLVVPKEDKLTIGLSSRDDSERDYWNRCMDDGELCTNLSKFLNLIPSDICVTDDWFDQNASILSPSKSLKNTSNIKTDISGISLCSENQSSLTNEDKENSLLNLSPARGMSDTLDASKDKTDTLDRIFKNASYSSRDQFFFDKLNFSPQFEDSI